jgi:leucyl aminopeptidase
MKIKLSSSAPSQLETECLVVAVVDAAEKSENGDNDKPAPRVLSEDPAVSAAAAELVASGEVTGKTMEFTLLHKPVGLKAKRLLLIGGGKAKSFAASDVRKIAGAAVRSIKGKDLKSFAIVVPATLGVSATEAGKVIAEGAYVGSFDPDYYKSDRKVQTIDELTIVAPANSDANAVKSAIDTGSVIGEAQNFARDLVNEPGNKMTPTILADRARKMCEDTGLACEIHGPEKIKELQMGAFWSVSQGSVEEPRLILGLVGKGITFDSGGISIKPSDGMEKMKYDMAGGAAMIGAMRAIAQLKPNVRVIGIVCASENMPSGAAQKPGDVQIAMSGKSIEIINTDAEGRLVLADGLHYAKQLGATHLIDAATLTGACVVALGMINAGIFCNDDGFYESFNAALKASGEKMWRLPVEDEYRDMIKSSIADIVNSGGRWGGAVTAAMFLKEFVGDTPWIHLDIAGVAWMEEAKPWIAKGPSGTPVRSLVEFVGTLGK